MPISYMIYRVTLPHNAVRSIVVEDEHMQVYCHTPEIGTNARTAAHTVIKRMGGTGTQICNSVYDEAL